MSFILESMAKNDCLRFFIYIGFLIKVFKYKKLYNFYDIYFKCFEV